MTTEESVLTPEEETKGAAADFNAGFDSVQADPSAEDGPAKPESSSTEAQPGEEPAEEEVFAGMTASQLKGLLARATKVDELEGQIRKAHGKIGELNSTLQELSQRAPAPAAPTADTGQSLEDLETDYPDIAKLADLRARKIVEEALKGRAPETANSTEQITAQVSQQIQREMEERFMAFQHPDWEQVIKSDDYQVWLAGQPEEQRLRATTTPHATELSQVVGSYKTWKGAAGDRASRSRERLEAGLTPRGVQGQTPTGPTEQDEFRAGFKSVRGG